MASGLNYWKHINSRSLSRRRLLGTGATGAAALAAAALVGCGDDDDDGVAPTNTPSGTTPGTSPAGDATATPTVAPQVKRGGTFVTAGIFTGDPPSLDPYGHLSFLSQYIGAHSYGRLLSFATGPGKEPLAEIDTDLAESYEIADEGLTFVFTLRPGVVFHDKAPLNGRALTTEDVTSSYERFKAESPNGAALGAVEALESPDERTLVFRLSRPFSPFIELIASPNVLWVMSVEANSGQIDPKQVDGVVGTGPWVFTDYRPSVELQFAAHRNYYKTFNGERLPLLAGLQHIIIAEYAQLLSQFVAGRTMWFTPRNADIASVRRDVRGAIEAPGRPGWLWAGHMFNHVAQDGLFSDPRLRRAVSMALDRDGLIDAFGEVSKLRNEGVEIETGWNGSLVPWGDGGMFWWLDPKGQEFGPAARWYEFDPAEARKLVEASGYDGQSIDFNFVLGRYGTTYEQFLEAQLPMLKNIGLDINPKPAEYTFLIGSEEGKNVPGIFYNYRTPYSTIDEYAYNWLHSDNNPRTYHNHKITSPEIVALVDKQRVTFDREERRQLVHEIERLSSDLMTAAPSVAMGEHSICAAHGSEPFRISNCRIRVRQRAIAVRLARYLA